MIPYFTSAELSHAHSLETLQLLYEYDDFMLSVRTMADLGCGTGLDLEWWATRTTREEIPRPLNIQCVGIDLAPELAVARRYHNIRYQSQDFETDIRRQQQGFDVLWCHDSFQFVTDPLHTLPLWYQAMSPDGMLVITVPQSTNIWQRRQAFDQRDHCYFHWTLVNLMHVLAVSGFDCGGGFFRKLPRDAWLQAVVYRSDIGPQDPRHTTWYQLADLGLLPDSARDSVQRHGYLRQQDLVLPWLDRSLASFRDH